MKRARIKTILSDPILRQDMLERASAFVIDVEADNRTGPQERLYSEYATAQEYAVRLQLDGMGGIRIDPVRGKWLVKWIIRGGK